MADLKGEIIAGVDVGGTFTDILLADRGRGTVRVAKVPTSLLLRHAEALNPGNLQSRACSRIMLSSATP